MAENDSNKSNLRFIGPYEPERGRAPLRFGATRQAGDTPVYEDYEPQVGRADLNFRGRYEAGQGEADFAFGPTQTGDSPGGDRPTISGEIDSNVGRPRVQLEGVVTNTGEFAGVIGGQLTSSLEAEYDVNVNRGPSRISALRYNNVAARLRGRGALGWYEGSRRRIASSSVWHPGRRLRTASQGVFSSIPRLYLQPREAWEQALVRNQHVEGSFAYPPRQDVPVDGLWEEAREANRKLSDRYTHPPRLDVQEQEVWEEAADIGRVWAEHFQPARWMPLARRSRYEYAIQPPWGLTLPPVVPEKPEFDPYVGDGTLQFLCGYQGRQPTVLWFNHPCLVDRDRPERGKIIVPVRRVYFVQNTAVLVRSSDGAEIPATGVNFGIDVDSFAWSFSATIKRESTLNMLKNKDGVPVEVEVHFNGQRLKAVVDRWSRERSFGERSYRVQGRGIGAYLSEPYARARAYSEGQQRLAQQLAEQELPQGWSLDWQLEDWLVPSNVWSYTNSTPMGAISSIASAAGGYVQTDMFEQVVRVLPRYPTLPWAWYADDFTPDVSLPINAMLNLGSESIISQPGNRVYVGGQNRGVLVRVTRDGTAGDEALETVTDPLITEVAAARQRGGTELAGVQRRTNETFVLPVSDNMAGLLLPGNMLEVTGDDDGMWRGIVRGVQVGVQRENSLTIRQTINVERHFEEEAA